MALLTGYRCSKLHWVCAYSVPTCGPQHEDIALVKLHIIQVLWFLLLAAAASIPLTLLLATATAAGHLGAEGPLCVLWPAFVQGQVAVQPSARRQGQRVVAACRPQARSASSRLHLLEGRLQHSTRRHALVPWSGCRLKASCVLSSLHARARCGAVHGIKGRDCASGTRDLLSPQKPTLHTWRICPLQGYEGKCSKQQGC